MKNDQCNSHQKHERKKSQERGILGRTRTEPKINRATFVYNGNKNAFDAFIEAVIHDYLNSSEMPQNERMEFSGKVEISEKKEKSLDF